MNSTTTTISSERGAIVTAIRRAEGEDGARSLRVLGLLAQLREVDQQRVGREVPLAEASGPQAPEWAQGRGRLYPLGTRT